MPLREKDLINFSKQAKAEKERKERLSNAVVVESVIDKLLLKGSDVTFSSDDLVGVAGFSGCAHEDSNCELTAETREACATDTAKAAASARAYRRSPMRQRSVTRTNNNNNVQPAQSSTARAPRTPPPLAPQGSPRCQRQRSATRQRESTSCAAQPSASLAAAAGATAAAAQTRAPLKTPPPQFQGSPVRGRQRSVTRTAHHSPARQRESAAAAAHAHASTYGAPSLAPPPLAAARYGQHVQHALSSAASSASSSTGTGGGNGGGVPPSHHMVSAARTHAVPMVPSPMGNPATAMMSAAGRASLDNHNRKHPNAHALNTAHHTAALNASKKRQRVQPQSIIRTRQQRARMDAEELNVVEENIAAALPPLVKP